MGSIDAIVTEPPYGISTSFRMLKTVARATIRELSMSNLVFVLFIYKNLLKKLPHRIESGR
jgi:tRNA G10  N-methylase Trm11